MLSGSRYFGTIGACFALLLPCFAARADDGPGLTVDGYVHVQWLSDFTRNAVPGHGFNLRRGRVEFRYDLSGAAAEIELGCDELKVSVKNARVEFRPLDQLGFSAGLEKMPFSREELTPYNRMLMIERSKTNDRFGDYGYLGRDIGLTARGKFEIRNPKSETPTTLNCAAGIYNGNGDRLATDNNDAKQFCERITFAPCSWLDGGLSGTQRNDSATGRLVGAYGADLALKLGKAQAQVEVMTGNAGPDKRMLGAHAVAGYRLGAFEPGIRLEWLAEDLADPMNRILSGTLGCNWYPIRRVQLKANLAAHREPGPDTGPELLIQAQVGF